MTYSFTERVNATNALAELKDRYAHLAFNYRFLTLLQDLEKNIPDKEVARKILNRLVKEFENPKCNEVEFSIMTKMTPDRVRHMMFFPDEEDMDYYPLLISSPELPSSTGNKEEDDKIISELPQRLVQIPFLATLYLKHVSNWKLIKSFIKAGGLLSLSNLLIDENVYLRSQAIDIFIHITDSSEYDWFKVPPDSVDKPIHIQLLKLSETSFLNNLLSNIECPFPGGSFFCLQILAFWLSWVRLLYSKDQKLNLSKKILESIKEWSEKEGKEDEEKELAKKLYDDFSRFPIAEEESNNNNNNNSSVNYESTIDIKSEEEKVEKEKKLNAESAKEKGNELYSNKNYKEAINQYTKAIEFDSSNGSYYANRAMCYLKLAEKEDFNKLTKDNKNKCLKLFQKCINDSDEALKYDKNHLKSYYRKAFCLYSMNELKDSVDCIREGLKIKNDDDNLIKLKMKVEKLIKKEKKMKEVKEMIMKRS